MTSVIYRQGNDAKFLFWQHNWASKTVSKFDDKISKNLARNPVQIEKQGCLTNSGAKHRMKYNFGTCQLACICFGHVSENFIMPIWLLCCPQALNTMSTARLVEAGC